MIEGHYWVIKKGCDHQFVVNITKVLKKEYYGKPIVDHYNRLDNKCLDDYYEYVALIPGNPNPIDLDQLTIIKEVVQP